MDQILLDFFTRFEASFRPPSPYRGQTGTNWLISRVWSAYTKHWLQSNYRVVQCEHRLSRQRRLDAAIWCNCQTLVACELPMDIALEWEWDNNKVHLDFHSGDFRKLLEVNARCGLAIVQTRIDGSRSPTQADGTLSHLHQSFGAYRRDNRSVGVVEIRRILQTKQRVQFACYFWNLTIGQKREVGSWFYS